MLAAKKQWPWIRGRFSIAPPSMFHLECSVTIGSRLRPVIDSQLIGTLANRSGAATPSPELSQLSSRDSQSERNVMRWIVRGLLIIAALLTSVNALAQERGSLLPHTSEGYGYESVVPEGWTEVGQGIFARQRDAQDQTLLAQQSAPVSAEVVLASLLPQLRLTEAPQSIGTHQGGALKWTLYQVNVALGESE